MWSEFKAFIARGNVLDLAIGVILGAAFGKIVTTFTEGIIMPVVGFLTGGVDFKNKFINLSATALPLKDGQVDFEAVAKAGMPVLRYYFKKLAAATPPPPQEQLLGEIRDILKAKA
jgi:large conductance mechanosensitive channel